MGNEIGTDDVLYAIRRAAPGLRASERKIGKMVLADPASCAELDLAGLAGRADTSLTSVTRFCKAIGYNGFRDFSQALVRTAARDDEQRRKFNALAGEGTSGDGDLVRDTAYVECQAIQETATQVDREVLQTLVDHLAGADTIDIYGFGGSGIPPRDMEVKLRRIGYNAHSWTDPHLALTSAAILTPGSVAIAFSHTGQTEEAVSSLEVASSHGAHSVAVTDYPDSPLGKVADATLVTVSREEGLRYAAISSRTAQLFIVDLIFRFLVHQNPARVSAQLAATLEAVDNRRITGSRKAEHRVL